MTKIILCNYFKPYIRPTNLPPTLCHSNHNARNPFTRATTELYAGLTMAWLSQSEHEADFTAQNTLYTSSIYK